MKILVVGLPRTASKFVTENVINLFGGQNIENDSLMPGWPITPKDAVIAVGDKIECLPHKVSGREYVLNRLQAVLDLHGNCAMKVHPNSFADYPHLLREIASKFDHVIHVHRKDTFEMLLSGAIAEQCSSYSRGEDQERKKLQLLENPIHLRLVHFFQLFEEYLRCQSLKFKVHAHVISEDIVRCKTSEEFCIMVGLEPSSFKLTGGGLEFGNKRLMVKNIDQLEELFNRNKHRINGYEPTGGW